MIWGTITVIATILGLYVAFKVVGKDVKNTIFPKDFWISEADNRARGQSFKGARIEDPNNVVIYFGNLSIPHYLKELKKDSLLVFKTLGDWAFPGAINYEPSYPFGFKLSEDNRLLMSFDIYDWNGRKLGEIEDGNFILNRGSELSWNFDETALEVLDNEMEVLMNIQFFEKDKIVLNGLFHFQGGFFFCKDGYGTVMDNKEYLKQHKIFRKPLTRIFEYHGKNYFGKRRSPE